ncbi:MAG: CPBP family intramembrane metalloprotease [Proteobacteria bacterium]|nr:CPBP family intramembrane metalloprotease [Pseudomonadota bacterium]
MRLTRWRAIATAAAVSVALAYSTVSGDLLAPFVRVEPVRAVPYLGSALVSFGDALVLVLLAALAAGRSPLQVIGQTGLQAPIGRPALWALLWLVPAIAVSLALARVAPDVHAQDIAWLGFGGPLAEEFVYRGLALGVLIRWCGWPVWLACVWPAVFFGVAHFGQGEDWGSVAGIVAITGLSGILLGWLFWRWQFNFWPPLFLHVGLNTIWEVFDLGENALGGWLGNVLRLAVVAVAVGASFWLAPARENKA